MRILNVEYLVVGFGFLLEKFGKVVVTSPTNAISNCVTVYLEVVETPQPSGETFTT